MSDRYGEGKDSLVDFRFQEKEVETLNDIWVWIAHHRAILIGMENRDPMIIGWMIKVRVPFDLFGQQTLDDFYECSLMQLEDERFPGMHVHYCLRKLINRIQERFQNKNFNHLLYLTQGSIEERRVNG